MEKFQEVTMKISGSFILSFVLVSGVFAQDRQFNFYLEEKDGMLWYSLATVETFPCMGYVIRTYHHWDEDTLFIDIRNFIAPVPCIKGFDVASKRQQVIPPNTKRFGVKMRWEGKVDRWIVDTKQNSFSAKAETAMFTSWFRN